MKKKIHFLILISIVLTLGGCEQKLTYIGQSRIVERSENKKPKWVKRPPKKDKHYVYFVGDILSPTPTDRLAYKVALSKVSHFINAKATTKFQSKEAYKNKGESAQLLVNNYIRVVSKASIKHAEEKGHYWEKIETLNDKKGVDTHYHVYVMVGVPKKMILEAEKKLAVQKDD
ncbi:MAG: hypothetical protein VW378_01720 [bacterium]